MQPRIWDAATIWLIQTFSLAVWILQDLPMLLQNTIPDGPEEDHKIWFLVGSLLHCVRQGLKLELEHEWAFLV